MDKKEIRYTGEDDAILAMAKEPSPRINFYEWERRLNMLMSVTMEEPLRRSKGGIGFNSIAMVTLLAV